MISRLWRILIGKPLATRRAKHERLSKLTALPIFASDALSSTAYATEEMFLVLWVAGTVGLAYSVPLAIALAALLFIVITSYRQTVYAYPEGGGAFLVARENLGEVWGLFAASTLQIGYVLTVAVSIAAGVAAIISAFPFFIDYRIQLCVLFIALVTLANLRGLRESGALFAPPTYGFVLVMVLMIGVGLFRLATGSLEPADAPPMPGVDLQTVTLFLVLTAFVRGGAALTGTEAVANSVKAFRAPESRNAAITLAWMGIILGSLFVGITYAANKLGVAPGLNAEGHVVKTLTSELAYKVFGDTPFSFMYYVIQIATTLILVLAANTVYADFPRLSSILARNGYAPRQLANLGDRLVFTNGILLLGGIAALLVVLFRGDTHALIPLYAIGVFMSFTFSQLGMVRRFMRLKPPRWQIFALINAIGGVTTAAVFMINFVVNFRYGSWLVILAAGGVVVVLYKIRSHYQNVREQLSVDNYQPEPIHNHKVLVLVPGVHRGVLEALDYARRIAQPEDIEALYINVDPQAPPIYRRVLKRIGKEEDPQLHLVTPATERMRDRWDTYVKDIPLKMVDSEYRSLIEPITEYVEQMVERDDIDRLTVVVPEFYPARWWQRLLHNQSAWMLRLVLKRYPKVAVTSVRYFLKR